MSAFAFFGAIEIGLIYGLVALGVYLTFRVLDFPDLSVDGSFPMGAAVAATAIVAGIDPWVATGMAIIAGGMTGWVTAFLAVRCGILHLLASILTMIAAFSINGWDTHRNQAGVLPKVLKTLSQTILTLRKDMGDDIWSKTAVVAMTEFGRTARENGTGGTDHGTAGLMLLAGGAVRGGKVYGSWPGLDEASLYDRRDLMPTRDVRAPAAWIMRAMTGVGSDVLERDVFPGLDLGGDPRLLR